MTTRNELESARQLVAKLAEQREELDIEIAKAKRKVAALAELVDETGETDNLLELNFSGLTDACRTALQSSKRPLSITGLQAMLEFFEFPIETYKSPLATIQTTIRRMMENGEVETTELADGKTGYKWVPERLRSRFKKDHMERFKGRFSR